MTEQELTEKQKQISKKILDLLKKDCSCPKAAEKLKNLNLAIDSLNRASYYLNKA